MQTIIGIYEQLIFAKGVCLLQVSVKSCDLLLDKMVGM